MNVTTPPELVVRADMVGMTEAAGPSATAPTDGTAPQWTRLLRYDVLSVVLAAAAAAGWYQLGRPALPVVAPAQAATTVGRLPDGSFRISAAEARLLRIEPVAQRDFRPERIAEGRISFNEERATPVFPPYTGRVVRAAASVGQEVRAGDVLFEVETTDLTGAANDLLAALDNIGKTRAQLELTRRNEARQRDLFAARAAARREVEQAQADLAGAEADARTAEANLAAARDRLRVLGRDAAAIAEIERTRRVNAVVAVAAPIGGTVVQRRVGPGQWLNAGGADPVFTIADLSEVWLVAAVREFDVPAVRAGQEVAVSVDALPGRTFAARLANVGNALDPVTRRLPVRAAVADPDRLLKPEMFASFRIAVGEAGNGLAVPSGALIHRGSSAAVWEALDDTRFIMRPVRTGLRTETGVQILEGLSPAARVVTGGALFIDRAATGD